MRAVRKPMRARRGLRRDTPRTLIEHRSGALLPEETSCAREVNREFAAELNFPSGPGNIFQQPQAQTKAGRTGNRNPGHLTQKEEMDYENYG
jgi:hypothetical protein